VNGPRIFDSERGTADIGHPVADAHVLDAARNASILSAFVRILYRFERLAQSERFGEKLACRERLARLQDIALPDVVAVDADALGQPVQKSFDRKRGLIRAKPAHRAAGRVIRVDGKRFHVDRRYAIRPRAMTAGPLQHLRTDRGIRALVADDAGLHRGNAAIRVTSNFVIELNRVPLGMNVKTFGPREREFHRPPRQPGHERRLRLDRHVFLAAERPAIAHELDLHALALDAEHRRDLPLIVEHALPLAVDKQRIEADRNLIAWA
jgi:hypothetical protein